ncbi:MAG: DUF3142 domain-containing protein [Pyrinomonadaceae bacterium]
MPVISQKRKTTLLVALFFLISLGAALALFTNKKILARFSTRNPVSSERMARFPKIILWAWERPENLNYIDTREIGVAFLAKTLYLRGEQTLVRPRLQPLRVPQGTTIIAVARIEVERDAAPALSVQQREKAVAEIAELAQMPNVSGVQIDFDAKSSERAFYRELIFDLRRRMPEQTALSITALASWCLQDDWISDLPVDEAVPMLFRMGVERRQIQMRLEAGGDFPEALCRRSNGISTDENLNGVPRQRRSYIFNPKPWSSASVSVVVERSKNEQQGF